jgi:hypothetical protein
MCRDKRTSGPRIGTDEPQEKQSQPLGLLPPLEKSGPSDSAGQQVCNHGYERECHPPLFADNIGQVNHEVLFPCTLGDH